MEGRASQEYDGFDACQNRVGHNHWFEEGRWSSSWRKQQRTCPDVCWNTVGNQLQQDQAQLNVVSTQQGTHQSKPGSPKDSRIADQNSTRDDALGKGSYALMGIAKIVSSYARAVKLPATSNKVKNIVNVSLQER